MHIVQCSNRPTIIKWKKKHISNRRNNDIEKGAESAKKNLLLGYYLDEVWVEWNKLLGWPLKAIYEQSFFAAIWNWMIASFHPKKWEGGTKACKRFEIGENSYSTILTKQNWRKNFYLFESFGFNEDNKGRSLEFLWVILLSPELKLT